MTATAPASLPPLPFSGPFIAFAGARRFAEGSASEVAAAVKRLQLEDETQEVLTFDLETAHPVDFDLRGTPEDVAARYAVPPAPPEAEPARGPGRPKLGVVAREVTLLPRHWEWLAAQPGGASVALRKLVEAARRDQSAPARRRAAQDAAYRFMSALAGNLSQFEEALRAFYAGDAAGFAKLTAAWPEDIRTHAHRLAAPAFE
ncbi:DUF2239 family protein [Roseixanthobacter glucoisosaccharinicivorans]|uniref:DUF2239 family protein n=1 Tax=Roseixanthobacter glucoisosaccharinicivorans TaxID=3119923 RepID=UPI003727B7F3